MPSPISTLRKPDRPVSPDQGFKDGLIFEALSELDHPMVDMYPTPTAGRSRTLWIAAAATLAALLVGVPALLTGVFQPESPTGPGTPIDVPGTTVDIADFATWQEWADWRDELNLVLERSAILAWLVENRFEIVDPLESCDNVLYSRNSVPTESGEITRDVTKALDDCWDAGRASVATFQPDELPHLYEALVARYECITWLHYDIPPPPTFDDFVKSWSDPAAEHWTPSPPRNFEAVEQVCPWPLERTGPLGQR